MTGFYEATQISLGLENTSGTILGIGPATPRARTQCCRVSHEFGSRRCTQDVASNVSTDNFLIGIYLQSTEKVKTVIPATRVTCRIPSTMNAIDAASMLDTAFKHQKTTHCISS